MAPLLTPKAEPKFNEHSTDRGEVQRSENTVTEFQRSLQNYGRSIIKSALDHTTEESQVLENNIITSKEKVIAHFTSVNQKLEMAEDKNQQQEVTIQSNFTELAGLRKKVEGQRRIIEGQEKRNAAQLSAKLGLLDSLEVEERKVKDLQSELANLRKNKKRKREDIVEVFERVEKVKVD